MNFVKIVSIIRPEKLEDVEKMLNQLDVPGVSVCEIKGYGEYANFFRHDLMVEHVQVEVFIGKARATEIAEKIMDVAHTGIEGDGIVAIIPVENVYHIRTKQKCVDEVC